MIRLILVPIVAVLSTGFAWGQTRQPIPSGSPCIPGDPVRRDCRSSPLYNSTPGSLNSINQAPNFSGGGAFGTSRRPSNDFREGVPQR